MGLGGSLTALASQPRHCSVWLAISEQTLLGPALSLSLSYCYFFSLSFLSSLNVQHFWSLVFHIRCFLLAWGHWELTGLQAWTWLLLDVAGHTVASQGSLFVVAVVGWLQQGLYIVSLAGSQVTRFSRKIFRFLPGCQASIIIMMMKKFDKLPGTSKMWHRDAKWTNYVGKTAPIGLLNAGLPQTFNFLKTPYLWSEIRRSAIEKVCLYTEMVKRHKI